MKKGFTLCELLILIVMIVAFAAIIAPTCVLASPVAKDTGQTVAIASDQSKTDPTGDHYTASAMEVTPVYAMARVTAGAFSSS